MCCDALRRALLATSVLETCVFTGLLPAVARFFFSSVARRCSGVSDAHAERGRYLSVRPFSRARSATAISFRILHAFASLPYPNA